MNSMATQPMTDPKTDLVNYSAADGIALLTLNDPPANTYSYDMMQQIDACILRARMDEDAQVVVITGSGEKFFCAGANRITIRLRRFPILLRSWQLKLLILHGWSDDGPMHWVW